jgi:nucleoside-diphosphate-sugar epimerase
MRILLTGASGFLGKFLLSDLQKIGAELIVLTRNKERISQFTAFSINADSLTVLECDLLTSTNIRSILAGVAADHLVHLAWETTPNQFWNTDENNHWMDASCHLIEAFCDTGGRGMTLAGTCFEYQETTEICHEDSTPICPETPYAQSKARFRNISSTICEARGIPMAWCRIFFPYGPGEPNTKIIPSLIDVFLGRRPAFSVSRHDRRDFIHARDVARGLSKIISAGFEGDFNISSGLSTSIQELVEIVAKTLGEDPDLVLHQSTKSDSETSVIVGDNGRLNQLSWIPEIPLQQGIEEMCRLRSAVYSQN